MKFYISARTKEIKIVKDIQRLLKNSGHDIILDWTTSNNLKPYRDNRQLSKEMAAQQIKAVLKSEVYLLISDLEGTGIHTELGSAIASNIFTGKPKIYVIGEHNDNSLFFFHPAVNRARSIADVLFNLEKENVYSP